VTVTTPHLRDDFCARYPSVPQNRIRTIYNGYDETDFRDLGAGDTNGGGFELVHAGLVSPDYRDPVPLLQAISQVLSTGLIPGTAFRLTFLGGGAYVRSKEFVEQISRFGLEKIVEIVDRVDYRSALRRQRRAAILLLLQASEDTKSLIPAKAFEYLRIGRPILAMTSNGATRDLLTEFDQCYVVSPTDQSTIQQTLVTLYRLWRTSSNGIAVSRSISRYERRNLTAELAHLLDGLGDPSGAH
jgi:glycosyltransferase involved in cell wall biosynthesis